MLRLLKKYPHVLAFGMLTAAFSGPGQTFLVSLFIEPMRESFSLSKSGIALLYSGATLTSALLLPLHGRLLDRVRLIRFTLFAGILLAAGCLVLSQTANLFMIFLGFLLVRNFGQGSLTLISSTTMARTFGSMRGKALGLAGLGYPMGEALFPIVITSWILAYGWRSAWVFLAGLVLLFFSPIAAFLLKNQRAEGVRAVFDRKTRRDSLRASSEHKTVEDWEVGRILRDWRYYVLQVPLTVTPAFLTALFFHQASLAEWKGWSMQLISAGFVAFAVSRGFTAPVIGPMIDRFTARKIFPWILLPLCAALTVFALARHEIWAFVYLALSGITMGLAMTVPGALWAEIYGTKHLGSIKGLQSAIIVSSTAATPPLMGWMLDKGWNPSLILIGMLSVTMLAVFMARSACAVPKRK